MHDVAALLLFGLGWQALAQGPWQTMSHSDRSFFAAMPGAPTYSSQKMKTTSGDEFTMHEYTLERGEEAFVAQPAIYPASVNTSDPRGNLKAGLDSAAKNLGGKAWKSVNWITVQGLIATDAVGEQNGYAIRQLFLLNGQRIVALTHAGPPGGTSSSNAARFVNSLRIAR